MSVQQVDFSMATCLVEINPEIQGQRVAAYTAFVSVLDNHGTVIRPLISVTGHRVRIRAGTERLALASAMSYLTARFGKVSHDIHQVSFPEAAVGRPILIADW